MQQISQSIDEGTYFEPTKMTVAGWMNAWLKDYLGNVKAGTVANYTRHVNNHIIPALGAVKLSHCSRRRFNTCTISCRNRD